jgi:putative membrane protein
MTASLIKGFEVHGFWSAIFGTIIISFVSWLLSTFLDDNGRIVYIINVKKEK